MKTYTFTINLRSFDTEVGHKEDTITMTVTAKNQQDANNLAYRLVRNAINSKILDEAGNSVR